jgi:peptidyl-dipeptidase Dcp
LAETNAFEMHLTDEKTLPDYPKELSKPLVLKQRERKRRLIFTLDHPSYVPFMTYADNRELRKISIAFAPEVFKTTNLTIKK